MESFVLAATMADRKAIAWMEKESGVGHSQLIEDWKVDRWIATHYQLEVKKKSNGGG